MRRPDRTYCNHCKKGVVSQNVRTGTENQSYLLPALTAAGLLPHSMRASFHLWDAENGASKIMRSGRRR
jgi:hypothetical protein